MSVPLANVGLPMLIIQMPAMVLALVPVILLEAWIAKRSYRVEEHLFRGVGLANFWSTCLGVPLAWLAMLPIALASDTRLGDALDRLPHPFNLIAESIIGMAWLPPYGPEWMVPLAMTAFLIPAFFLSVLIERRVLRHVWKSMPATEVNSAAWKMKSLFVRLPLSAWCRLDRSRSLTVFSWTLNAFPFVN